MWKEMVPALRVTFVLTILTGLIYPGVVTALCQLMFPRQADGSLVARDGHVVGSSLIGQNFARPEYFQPRPSAAGYDASSSSASNYGPTNSKLVDRVKAAIAEFRKNNPDYTGPLPADLVTASASGLDPDISPASAEAEAPRVAKARGITLSQLNQLIAQHSSGRTFGILGDPRVNVLELNLALDRRYPMRRPRA
jgi:potassium-transporting ATPase KdpC subunit